MKTRVISAIIALAIFIPIFLIGGDLFNITIFVISLIGLKEFIDIKETKKKMPLLIKIILYVIMTSLVFMKHESLLTYAIDIRLISCLFLSLLMPVVFYHDREKYSINDAFFMIGSLLFLGISFNLMLLVRSVSLNILLYLFFITIFTDSYAYITGMLIGRNKLLESISPKKTIEGLVGGTLFGVLFSATYYITVINNDIALYKIILITTFLSIIGQFGDLFFSAIKRYYGKKDFSNIMPGHGGVLDRLDSIIFVLLSYMILVIML